MRSEEWRTSEPKRASLRREWTSSVSSALPSARETWVARSRSAARSAVPSVSPVATSRTPRSCSRGVRPMARTLELLRGSPMSVRSDAGSGSSGTSGSAARAKSASVGRRAQMAPGEQLGRRAVGRDDPQLALLEERERARRAGAQLVGRPHGRRVELVALGRAHEGGARAAQHALAVGGALLLADQAGHAGHDEDEQDDRREDDDEQVDVAAAHLADDLDGRCDERRERQERQADRRQARRVPGGRLGQLAHRRMQRCGAPEEVEADPADVEDDLAVVGAVQRHDAVDEVGDEQRDDARGEEAERGAAATAVDGEADGGGEEQDVARRVRDRHELREDVHRVVVDVGRDERDPRDEREAQRHDERVDEAGAVAVRVAAPYEREQPDHERRVDEDVHPVADRRERHLPAEDARVGVRVEVAEPEQREPEREEEPRALGGRAVAADADEDGQHRREPQHVHDRPGALERRHPDVERAQQRTAGEQQLPRRRAAQDGAQARHAACSIGGTPASQSSPRSASSSIAAIAVSISASVFAAVTWRRKPTSCLGTSG